MGSRERVLGQLENLVGYLSIYSGLTIPAPSIYISCDDSFNAYATPDDKIVLTSGLFKHVDNFAEFAVGVCSPPDRPSLIAAKGRFILSWIVAHEFFHIARSHFKVLNESQLGVSARKSVEFDADMMAVVGLYRYLRRLNPSGDGPRIKGLIMDSIFWPIRAHVGASIADAYDSNPSYPSWHLRLWMVVVKLVQIDNGEGNGQLSDQATKDKRTLWGLLSECDVEYCRLHALPASTLLKYFHSQAHITDYALMSSDWVKIRESVRANQRVTKFGP